MYMKNYKLIIDKDEIWVSARKWINTLAAEMDKEVPGLYDRLAVTDERMEMLEEVLEATERRCVGEVLVKKYVPVLAVSEAAVEYRLVVPENMAEVVDQVAEMVKRWLVLDGALRWMRWLMGGVGDNRLLVDLAEKAWMAAEECRRLMEMRRRPAINMKGKEDMTWIIEDED